MALVAVGTARAENATPVYESKLMRLAEVLGALQFLRPLCGEAANTWRDQMDALLASETPSRIGGTG